MDDWFEIIGLLVEAMIVLGFALIAVEIVRELLAMYAIQMGY